MINEYTAAHNGFTYIDHSNYFGRFELTGRDRLDLLHRMSTQDLNSLPIGMGRPSVLTTALARIIDQLVVYNRGETALAITGPGMLRTVRGWLQKHIFFNDQIKTRDVSGELMQFTLVGPAVLDWVEGYAPGLSAAPMYQIWEGAPLMLAAGPQIGGARSYSLFAAPDVDIRALFPTAAVPLSDADYDLLRIEAGIPAAGHELTEDYIPLEAGLWGSVSFAKGCYIGQEIIARMESRNKLARSLVNLHLPALVPPGTPLTAEGRTVGSVTSSAAHPLGGAVALGYVRTEALGAALFVTPESAETLAVEVVGVPQR